MSNFLDACDKVCNDIYDFMTRLYNRGVSRDRVLQFAMAILCKAKGKCDVLTAVESELEIYDVNAVDINNIVASIQEICGNEIEAILPVCADIVIDKYVAGAGAFGIFTQPRELSDLVLSLVKEKGCKVIYNPFAGLASYAIANFIEKYYGQERLFAVSNIAKMRLELYNIKYAHYEFADSLKDWNDHGADCIVSTPPFGGQLDPKEQVSAGASSYEEFIIRKFLLSDLDYAFLVVGRVFCNSYSKFYDIRKEIVDSNVLDMIIDLPTNILSSTNIGCSILMLNKKRSTGERIKLIDGTSCFFDKKKQKYILDINAVLDIISSYDNSNKAEVSREEIINSDYNCIPQRHTLKIDIPEGYIKVTMNEIATLSSTGSQLQDNGEKGEYLHEPTLLISQALPKVEYVEASYDNPVFIKSSRYIKCKLDESKIDRDYFIYKFEHLDKKILNAYMAGAAIKRFTLRSLSELQFCIPDNLQSQKNALVEAKQAEFEAKVRELGLEKLLEQKKGEYIEVVRSRKHDMKPYMRELGSAERTIRHYITQRDNMPDFPEKIIAKLDKHNEALTKLYELINVFSDEQQFGEPEKFNLNKYLIELEAGHDKKDGYWIEYIRDDEALMEYGIPVVADAYTESFEPVDTDTESGKKIMEEVNKFPVIIDINHLDFERLVRNIIENAITHGFTDSNRDDYGISVLLTVDFEKHMFQIDFSNNGTPIPSGMDKQRYGILGEKAGMTGRTGRGGYIVKSIVENYHGDYDVFVDGVNTVVRILLPIAEYDYEYE